MSPALRCRSAYPVLCGPALAKDLAGIIIDGGYRDMRFVATGRLPVYSRHVTPMAGTTTQPAAVGEAVRCSATA